VAKNVESAKVQSPHNNNTPSDPVLPKNARGFFYLEIRLGNAVQAKRVQLRGVVGPKRLHKGGVEKRARLIPRRHHPEDYRRSRRGGYQCMYWRRRHVCAYCPDRIVRGAPSDDYGISTDSLNSAAADRRIQKTIALAAVENLGGSCAETHADAASQFA
jgi:hypothetical protein